MIFIRSFQDDHNCERKLFLLEKSSKNLSSEFCNETVKMEIKILSFCCSFFLPATLHANNVSWVFFSNAFLSCNFLNQPFRSNPSCLNSTFKNFKSLNLCWKQDIYVCEILRYLFLFSLEFAFLDISFPNIFDRLYVCVKHNAISS